MCVNGEEVFWSGGEHQVVDTLCWEESVGQWSVDVVDWTDVVEGICVFVVMECVGVSDWWSWSDVEGEVSVDGDGWDQDCGEHHSEVGEIWNGSPFVVENVSVDVEKWTWELGVVVHEVELKTVGWRCPWQW